MDKNSYFFNNPKYVYLALNAANQCMFELDLVSGKIQVSEECPKILGYKIGEYTPDLGMFQEAIHPDDLASFISAFIKEKTPNHFEFRRKDAYDKWVWMSIAGDISKRDSFGNPAKVIGIVSNINDSKKEKLKNEIRSLVFQQLLKGTKLTKILELIILNIENFISSSQCSILLSDFKKETLELCVAPSLPDFYKKATKRIKISESNGSCGTASFRKKRVIIENIQTHPFWAAFKKITYKANLWSCWSQPILDIDGEILGTFAIYQNKPSIPDDVDIEIIEFAAEISSIAISRNKIFEKINLYSKVFTNAHEGIIISDENNHIIDINKTFSEITGYQLIDIKGKNPKLLKAHVEKEGFYQKMWADIKKDGYWKGEISNRNKCGKIYDELLTISSLKDENDKIINYIGLFYDITEIKKQQKNLKILAHYDSLTKLPNRVLFKDRFEVAVARSKKTKTKLAICFLDLDNFKPANDTYGHDVGDKLLVEVTKRIKSSIRAEDTLSRQGGDEFTLILGDINSYDKCKEILDRILYNVSQIYVINGYMLHITTSLGITMYPNDESDLDTLIRHADQAMYKSKLAGKNCYTLFNILSDKEIIQKQNKLQDIQNALKNGDLCLYYQPKINIKTRKLLGFEALIRWNNKENGLMYPDEFLPCIDGSYIEIELGEWVTKEALKELQYLTNSGYDLEISINIASQHLQSLTFVENLKSILNKYPDINPHNLQIEILESSALGDLDKVKNIVNKCKNDLGVGIALDDFGTGYSSLTHLRNLPADTIKIDKSFVINMIHDKEDYAIIEGIIGLSHAFSRKIVAEGVESIEHENMLLQMGCEVAQGYGISKPMPQKNVLKWIENFTKIKQLNYVI